MTLSKSRFAVALECPRQLDYARDDSYYDARRDDEFLRSLAEGGHQVGELARQMFPGGLLIDEAPDDQVRRTSAMLAAPDVTLFEATIQHENLLVRTDILEKTGNRISLIEVKAKGFNPNTDTFVTDQGTNPVRSTWRSYLYDVAYQTYVMRLAYPQFEVTPYLMLLDKTVTVNVDGLNSMLPVHVVGRDVTVTVSNDFDVANIPPILRRINVADEVAQLLAFPLGVQGLPKSFGEFVEWASGILGAAQSFPVRVGAHCKDCSYYVDPDQVTADRKSGWAECMQAHTGTAVRVRRADTVFGLYRASATAVEALLTGGALELGSLPDLALDEDDPPTDVISFAKRRQLQVAEAQEDIEEPFMLHGPLRTALAAWKWPLHFIDFETSRPALPYHRGRTPYDQILFQFSHHVMNAQGHVEHTTECLEANPGVAPSLKVLRALRDALAGDEGTVVHWWTHENTVLKDIREQIVLDKPADAKGLIAFVDSLVGGKNNPGRLQDLGKIVSQLVFYPETAGSSSIKKVLPAALRHSKPLRDRYGAPIYGTREMPSLNFKDQVWVKIENGTAQDPYTLLKPLIDKPVLREAIATSEDDDAGGTQSFIADGGAAIIAYDQLRQVGLPTEERGRIIQQLLRYCELDTLAMVMVYQSLTGRGLGTLS
jgi:hypothetical protein